MSMCWNRAGGGARSLASRRCKFWAGSSRLTRNFRAARDSTQRLSRSRSFPPPEERLRSGCPQPPRTITISREATKDHEGNYFRLPRWFHALSVVRIIKNIFYDTRPDCRCAGSIGSVLRTGDLLLPGNGRTVSCRARASDGFTFDPRCCPPTCAYSSRTEGPAQLFCPHICGDQIPLWSGMRITRVRITRPQHGNAGGSSLLMLF
jgi:hypothetical protein